MKPGLKSLIMLCCLLPLPLVAQVFPGLEKPDVRRAIESIPQPEPPKPEPEPQPPATPEESPGVLAMRRYNETLAALQNGKRAQLKAASKHTDNAHESVRKYLEGRAELRLGYYTDAARTLAGVGHTVTREAEFQSDELKAQAVEIRSGKAHYYRAIALAMSEYRAFKDERELDTWWERATRAVQRGPQRDLQLAIDRKLVDEVTAGVTLREITGWLATGRGHWHALWTAEQAVAATPDSVDTWLALALAAGPREPRAISDEAPHYLKRRAALLAIRETWPQCEAMRNGQVDALLALSHFACWQIEDAAPYLEQQPYHNAQARPALRDARRGSEAVDAWLRKLKS